MRTPQPENKSMMLRAAQVLVSGSPSSVTRQNRRLCSGDHQFRRTRSAVTLGELAGWGVSLIAQTGSTFDLSTPQGKLITNLMASLAEFEHDLLRERVRSGIADAKPGDKPSGALPATGYRTNILGK